MNKKFATLAVAATMCAASFAGLVGCDDAANDEFKVGFIFLHDENSTYDLNFINAAKEAQRQLGLSDSQILFRTGVEEGNECYTTCAELVDLGCDIIFADSFGHESYMLKAAKEFPDVQFCHATGTQAHTSGTANYHNAFASIYEGRYLAGVAAGMKLKELGETKMGYVGAFPYAEVVSGFTSFYLGAKSVCADVTMEVSYTNSWYDYDAEKQTAQALIAKGCKLISQHADSMGAPSACEDAGVPNVSYNGSTVANCPNTFIVSSRIDWSPYFVYAISAAQKNEAIDTDWTGTIATGSVQLSEINSKAAAAGTEEKLKAVMDQLKAGTLHVFDTANFTVGGKTLSSYLADVDDMGDFKPETEVIKNGYFHESEYRSAPYFDIIIDGIVSNS